MTGAATTPTQAVDLLVVGAGAGGMTAALTGALCGLDVLLVEKTDRLGGASARSAGSIWIPNTHLRPPGVDSFENALTYLRAAIGDRLDEERAAAFLRAGPEMVATLAREAGLRLRAYPHHPDYLATLQGATLAGRALEAEPFDAAALGARFADIRPPLPEFMLFGGMMVDRTDIGHLMNASRRPSSLLRAARLLLRFGRDRLAHSRGTRLVMGNALIGRLYQALLSRNVPVALASDVLRLETDRGRAVGAVIRMAGRDVRLAVRAGVVLATGGFSRDPALRRSLSPHWLDDVSAVAEGATGDGWRLAAPLGGRLSGVEDGGSFWAPVSHRWRRDGTTAVFPHFVLDRGKPGAFAVGPDGRRFVNEATTYHLFGEALFAMKTSTDGGACHLICGDDFIARHGLGMVRPKRIGLRRAIADGYVIRADTLVELAARIGVPATALTETAARHDTFAETGRDADFGKGEDAYQRNLGDPEHGPNPCIGKLGGPPFHAVELRPGDIGASAGLACDAAARVLGEDGAPIDGLYACGADAASLMAGRYPGPGVTLGPAMTFGYIAARHAAGRSPRTAP